VVTSIFWYDIIAYACGNRNDSGGVGLGHSDCNDSSGVGLVVVVLYLTSRMLDYI